MLPRVLMAPGQAVRRLRRAGYLGFYEMDEPSAKAAAMHSLKNQTSHAVCDSGRSEWEVHADTVDIPDSQQ
jgi:hypothetical protein